MDDKLKEEERLSCSGCEEVFDGKQNIKKTINLSLCAMRKPR